MGRGNHPVSGGKREDQGYGSLFGCLKTGVIEALPNYLNGVRFSSRSICIELGLYWSEDPEEEKMLKRSDRMDERRGMVDGRTI